MNMWGFLPSLFNYLSIGFIEFLNAEGNELKSEYLIPSVINNLIQNKLEEIDIIKSFEIKKVYPNKIKIKIFEKKPIAILQNKKNSNSTYIYHV